MKTFSTLIVLLLFCLPSQAQILNAGFENWANGSPTEWYVNNIPGLWTTITQSNTAHSGNSAVKGAVVPVTGGAVLPLLMSGATGEGFALTAKPTGLKGWYQFHPQGTDEMILSVSVAKGTDLAGVGGLEVKTAVTSYTEFIIPIEYANALEPDKVGIIVTAGPDQGDPNPGAYFLLDDLELIYTPVGVEDNNMPLEFNLSQNYPNPFNPSTRIDYIIPSEEFVTLKLYDILGNETAVLVNGHQSAGTYHVDFDASSLSAGIYIYRISAGDNQMTRKMTVLK